MRPTMRWHGWLSLCAMALAAGCSHRPRTTGTTKPSPSASASASPSPSASAPVAGVDCAHLIEPPPGADQLCAEHVLGNVGEIAWQSYGVSDDQATVSQRYRAAAAGCNVAVEDSAPRVRLVDGDTHLEVFAPGDQHPSCAKQPAPQHRAVVLISRFMRFGK